MVPNPFRVLGRVLPGGRSASERPAQEAAEPETRMQPEPSGEPPQHEATGEAEESEQLRDGAAGEASRDTGAEQDTDAEGQNGDGNDEAAQQDGTASRDGAEDISDTPAPSVGPHTTFEKEGAEERLARHEQSDVDAMGLDKRREVVGGSYGPSFARQATLYGIFLLVVGLLVVGAILAVNEFDQPPEKQKLEAPWKNSTDPGDPSEIDFPPDSAPEQVPVEPDPTSKGGTDRA